MEYKQRFPPEWKGIEEAHGDADVHEALHGGKVDYEPLAKQRAQVFLLITCINYLHSYFWGSGNLGVAVCFPHK